MNLISADQLTSDSFENYILNKVDSDISASWQRMIVASVALYSELVLGRTLKWIIFIHRVTNPDFPMCFPKRM